MTKFRIAGIALGVGGVLIAAASVAAGDDNDARVDATSNAILVSSEACLESVQKGTKYHATPACKALGPLSLKYLMSNGSATKAKPMKYELRYVEAQRMAWTALAQSEWCGSQLPVIW